MTAVATQTHSPNHPIELTTPGTRSTSDSVRSIPGVLRGEWIKVTSLRSTAAISVLVVALSGLATWAIARYVRDEIFTATELFSFPGIFTSVFAAVVGILMFSSEAQHGTLSPLLTAQPARAVIAFSKTVMAAIVGALLAVLSMAAGIVGSLAGGIDFGSTAGLDGVIGRAVLFTVLASVLGLGLGMIARHSAAAISGLLVWWLVAESLIGAFVNERYARFMPFRAGNAMVNVSTGDSPVDSELMFSATENALIFGGYAVGTVLIGTLLLKKIESN